MTHRETLFAERPLTEDPFTMVETTPRTESRNSRILARVFTDLRGLAVSESEQETLQQALSLLRGLA